MLGEDRRVLADGAPAAILADRDLLIRANLIHEHLHEHGGIRHSHDHEPGTTTTTPMTSQTWSRKAADAGSAGSGAAPNENPAISPMKRWRWVSSGTTGVSVSVQLRKKPCVPWMASTLAMSAGR